MQRETYEKVFEIIRSFVKDADAIKTMNADTNLQGELGINSARFVDVILALEDAFDVEIDFDRMDDMRTVGDTVQVITEMRGGATS